MARRPAVISEARPGRLPETAAAGDTAGPRPGRPASFAIEHRHHPSEQALLRRGRRAVTAGAGGMRPEFRARKLLVEQPRTIAACASGVISSCSGGGCSGRPHAARPDRPAPSRPGARASAQRRPPRIACLDRQAQAGPPTPSPGWPAWPPPRATLARAGRTPECQLLAATAEHRAEQRRATPPPSSAGSPPPPARPEARVVVATLHRHVDHDPPVRVLQRRDAGPAAPWHRTGHGAPR